MSYLLDTNTLIYFFRGQGFVAERLLETPVSEVAISAVTLFELRVGIAKSSSPQKRLQQLDEVLSVIRVIPLRMPRLAMRRRFVPRWKARERPSDPWTTSSPGRPRPTEPRW